MRLMARYAYGEPFSEKNLGSTTVSETLTAALRENAEEGRYVTKTALDGVERVSAYHRVPGHGLLVLTGIATSHALQPWRRDVLLMGSLLACAGAAVALTSVAVFMQRRRAYFAERRVAQLVKEQQVMLDNELIGMVKLRNRSSLWSNRAMALMFGYEPQELAGMSSRMLYADEGTWHRVGTEGYEAIQQHGRYRTEVQMRRKDGSLIWIELYGAAVGPEESLWMFVDMTSLKAREASLSRQALHDPLTGLANRTHLLAELQRILSVPHVDGTVTAVCYLDLDGFKAVNDSHGHAAGDEVLEQVSQRMQACVRSGDLVARLGGDEFVVVLSLVQGVEQVRQVTDRLLDTVCAPLVLKSGHEAPVAASVGVAMAPAHGLDAEHLLNLADAAMYEAKKAGKRQVRFAGGA
jgi:diguanylate cyclase (GGDEF)-like protein/PAS domain S-box-containing protein